MRSKAFACLLRQEVAYFDQVENTTGAICHRLSSDTLAVNDMFGNRFCTILETIAVLIAGLIFSLLLNWSLALTVLAFIIGMSGVASSELYIQVRSNRAIQHPLQGASSV